APGCCWSSRTPRWPWSWPTPRTCWRPAGRCCPGRRPRSGPRTPSGAATWASRGSAMERFLQVVVDGIADGSIYAALALAGALAFAFVGGMVVERVLIRPVEGGNPLNLVIVTLGLFILVNAAAGWI